MEDNCHLGKAESNPPKDAKAGEACAQVVLGTSMAPTGLRGPPDHKPARSGRDLVSLDDLWDSDWYAGRKSDEHHCRHVSHLVVPCPLGR
eukprot:NODE_2069_length_1212_cov_6.711952_g1718_i0.p4 GENE.NODE_2069_length_1212_cov_6.711952_g1718_i0~~NODE_2069_length_1212_cov_6.711952_g1718_i0.p4  ORF type:complete len:90 (-),score=5.05 NODE_2069_length_1212_cov_6.711952_g1718_i0:855-1124(-)